MKFSLATVTLGLAALPELVSAGFSQSCTWSWMAPKYVVATCTKINGQPWTTRQDMNLCLGNDYGYLFSQNNGQAFLTCSGTTKYNSNSIQSWCQPCDEDCYPTYYNLDNIMENLDGWLWCHGHRSAPYSG
ncbi:hypothetical protein QBC38DRAFT_537684 [Podospora fimiseda]|uniref:Cyanovirin-N domain-containing protein n=1 Tax=Podospora fimiseda TaxID=252190 RepID=A0AAN7H1C8_9PEZI|nr:hypothetical protein QBC38DRAFT_537684 [Podospora fimiseda]